MRRRGSRSGSTTSAGCRCRSARRAVASRTPRTRSPPRTRSRRPTRPRRRRCRPTSTCSPRTRRPSSRSRRRKRTRTSPTRRPAGAESALSAGWRSAAGACCSSCSPHVRAIVVWKRRRTRRRRAAADPAARIAGAWLELTDRYEEAGARHARSFDPARGGPVDGGGRRRRRRHVGPARRTRAEVDRAAYDRISPPPEAADVAWRYSDEAVDALLANQSLPRRTRMRVDPRTLRRRDPLAGVATLDGPTSAPTDDEP